MYSLNMPVSKIRTKVRSEFEKHRYVNQVNVVDVLLFQGHSEFQVGFFLSLNGREEKKKIRVRGWNGWLISICTGNAQLLETTGACDEVLQIRGRCVRQVAR